jgi:circadian clock protein KaiB
VTAPPDPTLERFEAEVAAAEQAEVTLTLYVSGASDLAARAVANARQLCELHLAGRYHLAVVDIHDDPAAVISGRVLATPTLVKTAPPPVRKVVGDLSETAKVLLALQLSNTQTPPVSG